MRKGAFPDSVRAARFAALLIAAPLLLGLAGCTNLDEDPVSSITPANFYRNEDEVLGGLAAVYANLRGTLDDYYNLTEVSSDEIIVPTRGQDWYDNGAWLEMDKQTWGPSSVDGTGSLNGAWNNLFTGVARANVVLDALPNVDLSDKDMVEAELKTLRGFYYYLLMDMFGGVPIAETPEIKARARATRQELFAFIEQDLLAAREALPAQWPASSRGRMTKGAADAILASMYINAGVFTKDDGISATDYNSCAGVQVAGGADACQAAIDAVDRIINSGVYSLSPDYFSNFSASNSDSPENILIVNFLAQSGLGLNFVMRFLHYNQFNPSPWNGFATIAEVYNTYDPDDLRRNVILIGPQVNVETGQPVKDRQGNPLVFTLDIPDPTQATEGQGARWNKFTEDPNHVAENNGNDYTYFRLAEMYLIKAEALNEQGNTAEAVNLVNAVRARAFDPPKPLSAGGYTQASFREAIYNERLFELSSEAKRRQDMIRFGKFTAEFGPTLKDGSNWKLAREPYRVLMPIPQPQLDINPMLTQNPGY